MEAVPTSTSGKTVQAAPTPTGARTIQAAPTPTDGKTPPIESSMRTTKASVGRGFRPGKGGGRTSFKAFTGAVQLGTGASAATVQLGTGAFTATVQQANRRGVRRDPAGGSAVPSTE
ncbi:hypothetical protein MCNF_45400 [Mycolicibacterium confluentis]|uniref:Uncharacterized protein n=1 Tax=Mycolicibacterium confluentis TaxID=28047 RepID=A0A7I7Y2N3_9MYCO|nr:hypothetical protein MCNF_45400 [Mycolicibacterium confluentis]